MATITVIQLRLALLIRGGKQAQHFEQEMNGSERMFILRFFCQSTRDWMWCQCKSGWSRIKFTKLAPLHHNSISNRSYRYIFSAYQLSSASGDTCNAGKMQANSSGRMNGMSYVNVKPCPSSSMAYRIHM